MSTNLRNKIFSIKNQTDFLQAAFEIFHYQSEKNAVYNDFISSLGKDHNEIRTLTGIPFLPVEFFRNQKVVTGNPEVEMIFESSGTTGTSPGRHFISDLSIYEESFLRTFTLFYGDPGTML
jgi:hypothetical protein